MNFFYQNILNQPNWSFFSLFSKLFSRCYCSPKESEDISPENESSDTSFSPINISKTKIDDMFEDLNSTGNSPFSGHINNQLRTSSPLENLQFQDAFDKFMLSCCYTLTLNIVLNLWLWATFNFASLKSKQQSMAFVEKFPFVKKIVDFYSSMDPQNLKTIRIFIIIISLICNLLLAGNLLGLWLCFQKIRKLFLEK